MSPPVNRLISTNLAGVRPDRLPPPRREGPVRALFIHGNILGFVNVAAAIKEHAAARDDLDCVHVDLVAATWMKVLGKSVPGLASGWDQHAWRHLRLWGSVIRRWFSGPLDLARFDVVHLMTQTHAAAITGRRGRPDTRFAVNVDSTTPAEIAEFGHSATAKALYARAERRIFDAADLLVTRNGWAAASLRRDFAIPDERIHVARNALAAPAAHRWDGRPAAGPRPRIAFVGNNWRRKGGDVVLAQHQRRLADRAELHVFGDRVRRDDAARNVVWHGRVPRERLIGELLPSMDLFVLASRYDMLPWALLEAAGAGLPMVAPRTGGIPEIVVEGETGRLVAPGDGEALGAAMAALVDDPAARERLGRAARARLIDAFDPARTYPALLDRLVALADEPREDRR